MLPAARWLAGRQAQSHISPDCCISQSVRPHFFPCFFFFSGVEARKLGPDEKHHRNNKKMQGCQSSAAIFFFFCFFFPLLLPSTNLAASRLLIEMLASLEAFAVRARQRRETGEGCAAGKEREKREREKERERERETREIETKQGRKKTTGFWGSCGRRESLML